VVSIKCLASLLDTALFQPEIGWAPDWWTTTGMEKALRKCRRIFGDVTGISSILSSLTSDWAQRLYVITEQDQPDRMRERAKKIAKGLWLVGIEVTLIAIGTPDTFNFEPYWRHVLGRESRASAEKTYASLQVIPDPNAFKCLYKRHSSCDVPKPHSLHKRRSPYSFHSYHIPIHNGSSPGDRGRRFIVPEYRRIQL
jgi:hypothetical protein